MRTDCVRKFRSQIGSMRVKMDLHHSKVGGAMRYEIRKKTK